MRYALLFAVGLLGAPPPNQAAADFAQGRWDALYARFGPQMKAAVTIEQIRQLGQFGKCQPPAGAPASRQAPPGFEVHIYTIVCEQRTLGLSITTTAEGLVEGLRFVEPPTGLEVVTGNYHLPARLTLPEGAGPFPAVVLVHGSGPQDMDETMGPNKPFRDIAEGLAARGIATLRYTKRTRQYGASLPPDLTLKEEVIEDAVSAAALLRKSAKIDPRKIFVLGHSLGAYTAPRIGQADPALAGLVLLAGNTRSLETLIDEQVRYLGGTPEVATEMKKRIPESYWKDLAAYRPVETAKALTLPMLILQGERDYQVTMEDFKGWEVLKSPRVKLKSYPALNHLFQTGEGKSKPEEYGVAKPFDAGVLDDIATWIKR